MSETLPPQLKATFLASAYRNWLSRWPSQSQATLLHWAVRPERDNPTAKNFIFFTSNRTQYLVTLMEPSHTIYQLNMLSGFMQPAFSTPANLGFPRGIRTSLSAGPVKGKAGLSLAVAHLSMGGWVGAYRKPFFYAFETAPPYKIRCATPAIYAGLSEYMEYPMHIERHGKSLYLSLGVDNCWSALVKLSLADVMAGCRLPMKMRSTHILRVGKGGRLVKYRHAFGPIWKGDHAAGSRRPISGPTSKLLPCLGTFCPTRRSIALERPNATWPALRRSGSTPEAKISPGRARPTRFASNEIRG